MSKKEKDRHVVNSLYPEALDKIKVKDIMNQRPPVIDADVSIGEVVKHLRTQKEDYLLVVGTEKKLVGIVTESDILYAFKTPSTHKLVGASAVSEIGKKTATRAAEIMTKNPVTIFPDMDVQEALSIMIAHKFRHLPVVDQDKLVGSIAISNILDYILRK